MKQGQMHNQESKLEQILHATFGHKQFRKGQKEAIDSILNGKDVLAILPTGGGKSLIYQFPSIVKSNGITIVISPLIALMQDQVEFLKGKGIEAEFCNSTQDELEQMRILSKAVTGKLRLLYISPERAMSYSFQKLWKEMPVELLAIDEAHCVSQWGHDFRPEYRELSKLRESHPGQSIPLVAVTATATNKVMEDISNSLGLQSPQIVRGSFFRPNLRFQVEYPKSESEKEVRLLELLDTMGFRNKEKKKAIIYCASRQKVESVYQFLKSNGFPVGKYHAGRTDSARTKTQIGYMQGKLPILVATNAFGMGMDSPDVRLVVHYQVPASLESYYQEAGRAGRDGLTSDCVLFFQNKDFVVQNLILKSEPNRKAGDNLLGFVRMYGEAGSCRQSILCSYFGEKIQACGNCDICSAQGTLKSDHSHFLEKAKEKKEKTERLRNYRFQETQISQILAFVESHPNRFGRKVISKTLSGKKDKDIQRRKLDKSPLFACLSEIPEEAISLKLESLIESGTLVVKGGKYPKISLKGQTLPRKTAKKNTTENLTDYRKLLTRLKSFRDKEAIKLKWKKYMVLQNAVLARIAKEKPDSLEELRLIKGLGEAKVDRFGEGILDILRSA